ncbi:MAG: hypothetical protein WCP46_09150 [Alphaproteobacteria bacterium]
MAGRNFHLLINSFEVITRNNYTLTHKLSEHLFRTLEFSKSDADILPLYNFYTPIHQQFEDIYGKISHEKGTQLSKTNQLKTLLKGLTRKVNQWDLAMLIHYDDKNSPDYKSVMPKGHTPFLRGKYKDRISRVKLLSIALTDIVELAATKADVDDYLNELNAAYENQTLSSNTIEIDSTDIESERINICNGQLYVLGGLYQKFYKTPALVGNFFFLQKMKQHRQLVFNASHLHPQVHKKVLKRTFKKGQLIVLKNKGITILRFYLAYNLRSKTEGEFYIDVAPRTQQKRRATDLGDNTENKYLMVCNLDTTEQGAYEVELTMPEKI